MKNYKMSGTELYGWKTINFLLLAIIITYLILYLFLQIQNNSLFFAGAIAGGLWGIVWDRFLNKHAPKGYVDSPFPRSVHFFMFIAFLGMIATLIFYYPIPTF